MFTIADLHDEFTDQCQLATSIFTDYGGVETFCGPIVTIKVDEDFLLIRETLTSAGEGQVLVIDGNGSMNTALLGDRLARAALDNGWAGLVINGCIRDSGIIREIPIGVKALNTCARKPSMEGSGETDVFLQFAGVVFKPGDYLYADPDGLLVSFKALI